MKRFFTLFVLLSSVIFVNASGGWACSVVNISKAGNPYSYTLYNDIGWTDGDWLYNQSFQDFDFGTPESLILNGGYGDGWTDDSPGYDATSFKIYYRVYESSATPGEWNVIDLNNSYFQTGNNYTFSNLSANVDLLSYATLTGTYTYKVEIVMTKNQYYTGGNWNSMIPGGQDVAYAAETSGYIATFTKTNVTTDRSLVKTDDNVTIKTANQYLKADFAGSAFIQLMSVNGQVLDQQNVSNEYTHYVTAGAYLLKINNQVHKILVR